MWYSSQGDDVKFAVIEAAEAAQEAGQDIHYAYGKAVNPEGTTAESSNLGVINGLLINVIPDNETQVTDHGIPCILREASTLEELPVGVVVVGADGSATLVTEENAADAVGSDVGGTQAPLSALRLPYMCHCPLGVCPCFYVFGCPCEPSELKGVLTFSLVVIVLFKENPSYGEQVCQ